MHLHLLRGHLADQISQLSSPSVTTPRASDRASDRLSRTLRHALDDTDDSDIEVEDEVEVATNEEPISLVEKYY